MKALKKSLNVKFGMSRADVVVLWGSSAGGMGAWMNCNDFMSGLNSNVDARCMVDSGGWMP